MYNLPPLALLLSLIVTSHIATSTTLSSSSSPLKSTSLPAGSAFSSATAPSSSNGSTESTGLTSTQISQISSKWSKATTTQSTGSIPAQSSQVSIPSSYLNESASSTISRNISIINQSLTEDFYERGPVLFSASPITGTGGKYQVWLALGLASLIISAYHNSPPPISDGEIVGDLPKCGGSTFVPYCTEIVAKTAWNDGDFTGLWPLTRPKSPVVPSQQQGTFARLTRFMTALGIFSSVTPVQQSALVEGIFAGCENIFRQGPGLPLESYATFIAGLDDVLCTAAPTPTTTVCPTMTISYPQATAPPYSTTAYVPAGDPRCRAYNPNVDWQPAGTCDAGLEWGGCPCDASSNSGFFNELTGPFSNPQNVVNFAEAIEDVKAPVWVWNVTLMGKPFCSAANALTEAAVTSIGTTTAACQALPTLPTNLQFGAASINNLAKGFCANFKYGSDCSEGMQQFCNRGSGPASTCLRAAYPNNRNPQNFKSFEIVAA